jgi:hypothetical protein
MLFVEGAMLAGVTVIGLGAAAMEAFHRANARRLKGTLHPDRQARLQKEDPPNSIARPEGDSRRSRRSGRAGEEGIRHRGPPQQVQQPMPAQLDGDWASQNSSISHTESTPSSHRTRRSRRRGAPRGDGITVDEATPSTTPASHPQTTDLAAAGGGRPPSFPHSESAAGAKARNPVAGAGIVVESCTETDATDQMSLHSLGRAARSPSNRSSNRSSFTSRHSSHAGSSEPGRGSSGSQQQLPAGRMSPHHGFHLQSPHHSPHLTASNVAPPAPHVGDAVGGSVGSRSASQEKELRELIARTTRVPGHPQQQHHPQARITSPTTLPPAQMPLSRLDLLEIPDEELLQLAGRRSRSPRGHGHNSATPIGRSPLNTPTHGARGVSPSSDRGSESTDISHLSDSGSFAYDPTQPSYQLPLCPDDGSCLWVNDPDHQQLYSHTCRLKPCYHAHLAFHNRCFRHRSGQGAVPSDAPGPPLTAPQLTQINQHRQSRRKRAAANAAAAAKDVNETGSHAGSASSSNTSALTGPSSFISPHVPNSMRIYIQHKDESYEIWGDWTNVRVHTFKRYLLQFTQVHPLRQRLALKTLTTGTQSHGSGYNFFAQSAFDDDTRTVSGCGVQPDSVVVVYNRDELVAECL